MNFTDRLKKRGWYTLGIGEIGEQGRCVVHRVQNDFGEKFVVKLIKPFSFSQVRVSEGIIHRILNAPRPDIEVGYRQRWEDIEGTVILMDGHDSSLRRWFTDNMVWYRPDWYIIMAGIAMRLTPAHAEGYVHKDLKPSNILIDRLEDGRFHEQGIYISDYGMPFYSRLEIHGQLQFVPGTRAYLAPEIRENGIGSISTKSDIWALGCIGYELCLGKKLAMNRELLKKHVSQGRKNPGPLNDLIKTIPERFGDEVCEIIRRCLEWDPDRRCTAVMLRDHLFKLSRMQHSPINGS